MTPPSINPPVGDERETFEAWAASEWEGKSVPDAAWLGWRGRAALAQQAPAAEPARVYLVPTGEAYEGRETYTRHEEPPPLSDFETLYATPPAIGPLYSTRAKARRYDWLRERNAVLDNTPIFTAIRVTNEDGTFSHNELIAGAEMDAAIDAALAADKKGEAK